MRGHLVRVPPQLLKLSVMAVRSHPTREKLIAAGRRRFADEGWTTARVRDIIADARQSNDSAINYHFGSRAGLLQAILRIGVEEMESARRTEWDALGGGDGPVETLPVRQITDMVIRPLADHLQTQDGIDFIRIVGQLGPYTSVERALETDVLQNTVLRQQVEHLTATVVAETDQVRATHRIRLFLIALIAMLSARALKIAELVASGQGTTADDGIDAAAMDALLCEAGEFPHEKFVDEIVLSLSAALVAR